MDEPDRTGETYTPRQVEVLIGLWEGFGRQGTRHVTALDLICWAQDPGGDLSWFHLLQREDPGAVWTARRGPLRPDSEMACVLYDLECAVRRLPLLEQAVLALTVFGFTPTEIATVIDPDRVIDDEDLDHDSSRELGSRRRRIARLLEGRPRRDSEGNYVRDEDGNLVYTSGVAVRLARMMNGDR